MDKKKEEVYQHLIRHTAKQLQQRGSLGRDALNISLDLQMDRSNVSRLLNQLHHEGRLIKTQGRPTLFFARTPLENEHPDVHISKGEEHSKLPEGGAGAKKRTDTGGCFPSVSRKPQYQQYV